MSIKNFKPITPSLRHTKILSSYNITKNFPEKTLTNYNHKKNGRNFSGKITIRHKGSGHKRLYRNIDFKRNKYNIKGFTTSIEYDPNRNCNISLINYIDGEKRYILHPSGLNLGDYIISSENAKISIGNTLPLKNIPLGTYIHNIEITPKKGGQLIRSAGLSAKILSKIKNLVIIKLPSYEIRMFNNECRATIGILDNEDFSNINLGKAGRSRNLGIRPTTRGSAMNPIDHPHGGGSGKSPIGRKHPLTPWGKPTLGKKTRKNKHNKLILFKK